MSLHRPAARRSLSHDTGRPADDPSHHERYDELRRTVFGPTEDFDRLAFARRALDALDPPDLAVLIRHGHRVLRVETGTRWERPGQRWASFSIPPDATREEIVFALLELVDARRDGYWSEVLLSDSVPASD